MYLPTPSQRLTYMCMDLAQQTVSQHLRGKQTRVEKGLYNIEVASCVEYTSSLGS